MDDVLLLSRIQFAFTIAFHYLFPPLSIGLGVLMVIMEGTYLRTGKEIYHQMARFWTRVFALTFAVGVASGIVMEFQFGTNWATYSRYVGDVFGSALAAEGIFAFFLESGFLAILLFGWNKVSKPMHFFATVMVCLGAHFSAVWIVVANSWMQTPAGFHIVGEGMDARAEIVDFWAMVFNPSSMDRLSHVLVGCWQAGAWLAVSVSAYYLLRGRHEYFARKTMQIALPVALVASLLQLVTGHSSAEGVAEHQPVKLAAMEGHYETGPHVPMSVVGWVNEDEETVTGLKIPNMLSILVTGSPDGVVQGLDSVPAEDRPPVNFVFQTYHLMVAIGMGLIGLSVLSTFFLWRGTLYGKRWLLWVLVVAVLGPQVANQAGWFTAEVGRQPWIVYNLLRTSEALSQAVTANMVLASLIMFGLIYLLLFAVFLFLLDRKIRTGPDEDEGGPVEEPGKPRASV